MRTIIFLLIMTISFAVDAQTFIGKTQNEVVDIQTKKGNTIKCSFKNQSQNDMIIEDAKHNISFYFAFDEKDICITYSIRTHTTNTRDSIQTAIQLLCTSQLPDKACIQKIDGKVYKWFKNDVNDYEWEFVTTEIKQ